MRNFQPIRLELFRERNHLLQMIEILPVHHQVDSERNRKPANHFGQNYFVRVSLRPSNPIRRLVS